MGSKNKSSPSSKEYLTKLFNTTVEKARNEFSTRASTLRRSKRNRLEDRQKRLSWNANLNNYSDQQNMQTATAVGLDKIDSKMADSNFRTNASATANVTSDGSDKSTSTKSSQLTNASSTASSSGSKGAKKKTGSKPTTTILSLEDRDLVIIDGNDIKESVQNESEVIVVDHPPKESGTTSGDVDLMDILGKDWPALAGDTAHVLNNDRRSSSGGQVMKPNLGELMLPTRNKSMNIISHLTKSGSSAGKGSTLPRTSGGHGHGQGHHQHSASVGGSVNSSFESSYSGEKNATGERKKSE